MTSTLAFSVALLIGLTCCTPLDPPGEVKDVRLVVQTPIDDSAVLQAAIDEGRRTGQPVRFEHGEYLVDDKYVL